jgi:Ser/Thr protein kinase RdoA (MazF antagonist)
VIEVIEGVVGTPVALEELKHKPGRRRTVRARGPEGSAIVKLYASDRASVVARRVASLAGGPHDPVLPVVLHVDPKRRVVVLSDVPGTPLRASLLQGDLDACSRVGVALGAWHTAWTGAGPAPLRRHTFDREREILDLRAGAVSSAVGRAVAGALPGLAGEWACTTVVHRDLYEEQILVGERTGLIDLDDAALGPPELDLGNLLAHVELLEQRSGRELARETRAIRDGYGRTGPALDRALLDRCRRLTLLRLACLNDDPVLVERALANGAAE